MMETGRVTTEGDELYYEVRDSLGYGREHAQAEGQEQRPVLLMIPGGRGDAGWYARVADILCDEYKVITYDRRANARSTMNEPQNFEISQQSRDAVAVLDAAGAESAFVVGNSSGAVIALDMAKTQPQAVRAIVAHEPPVTRVHPQSRKLQRFFAGVYATAFRFGTTLALLRFSLGVPTGMPLGQLIRAARQRTADKAKSPEPYLKTKDISDFFVKQELLPVTNYLPDTEAIRRNRVKVYMAVGKINLDKRRWVVDSTQILAQRLGCETVTFPGHHISYWDMPQEWAATLRRVLHKAETSI
jgi:pimeloyl-ACP methyl ester carboxylesterase